MRSASYSALLGLRGPHLEDCARLDGWHRLGVPDAKTLARLGLPRVYNCTVLQVKIDSCCNMRIGMLPAE